MKKVFLCYRKQGSHLVFPLRLDTLRLGEYGLLCSNTPFTALNAFTLYKGLF